jgi:hypothetical protein
VLHGEQRFELHRPLSTDGTIHATHRVSAVADKGPGRGALLYFDTELSDAAIGEPVASLRATHFLRGDGGCGNYGATPAELDRLPDDNVRAIASISEPAAGRPCSIVWPATTTWPSMPILSSRARPDLTRRFSHGFGVPCRAVLKRFARDGSAICLAGLSR